MAYTKEQREAKKLADKENTNITKNENITNNNKSVIVEKENINNVPLSTSVLVRSNCYGQLIYKSKKTGFQIEWDNINSQQYMSLDELLTMRNTYRKFYEKNWIIIDGFVDEKYSKMFSVEEILDFLQVKNFYKNLICPENIDDIFDMSPEQIENRIKNSSSINKDFIIIRANELIESGKLLNYKTMTTLEKALNCELSRPE